MHTGRPLPGTQQSMVYAGPRHPMLKFPHRKWLTIPRWPVGGGPVFLDRASRGLNLPPFRSKAEPMIPRGDIRFRRGKRLLYVLALAFAFPSATISPVSAQLFSDRPPPIPPASVPDPGAAVNLAPP